ncbi:MAG TPA: bacteriohemerythrin [bacterium]|jgi:hemerythrin
MALVWNPRLSTGLDWQDAQHQELFKRVNRLLDAMLNGQGVTSVGEVFTFLEEYVVKHFGNEERFMKLNSLTCYAKHKAAHEEFIRTYTELKKEFNTSTSQNSVCLKLQTMLSKWLTTHIGTLDKELADQTVALGKK